MILKLLPFIFIGILILEFYVYQAVKNLTKNKKIKLGYWLLNLTLYFIIIYLFITYDKNTRDPRHMQWLFSLFVIFLIPKILVSCILLIGDLFRLVEFIFKKSKTQSAKFPSRRKFISASALALGGLLSYSFIDGIVWGKYRHFIRRLKIKIPNLPKNFKGYKVVQISDVHSGSFAHPEKLQHAIDMINEQKPDLLLFTGDMVNAYAEEFEPFVQLFSQLKAKDGKLAILGNHDYGGYGKFNSKYEHDQNVPKLIRLEEQAGFKVLRNEHQIIQRGAEQLYIIGVENWGLPPFPQYGDLDKAVEGIPHSAAKILMSHDPTHFDEKVKTHPSNIALTLSGHTHGMQFGLDLKNIKWSPVQYKYPKWADLYESNGKMLYVNRGFGVIGYPGRVGVNPEITVFELY
ncbi:metallophosphoesterase [Elizabethkingia sp. JS20170427COW]|uniref:metallophosphoesterase n=1 Tax=Elizabethkingia sp. JS20170427COW TaxID=2583851 RepID=UPI00111073F6|nr:metallophosphoesterase [Elizabethkingia sp. JS20170427COW]QCX53998.1 metallophosphoesterase [Elizabethkingia sp. JS20170427COW]